MHVRVDDVVDGLDVVISVFFNAIPAYDGREMALHDRLAWLLSLLLTLFHAVGSTPVLDNSLSCHRASNTLWQIYNSLAGKLHYLSCLTMMFVSQSNSAKPCCSRSVVPRSSLAIWHYYQSQRVQRCHSKCQIPTRLVSSLRIHPPVHTLSLARHLAIALRLSHFSFSSIRFLADRFDPHPLAGRLLTVVKLQPLTFSHSKPILQRAASTSSLLFSVVVVLFSWLIAF